MKYSLGYVIGIIGLLFSGIAAEKLVLPQHIIPKNYLQKDPAKRLSSYPFLSGDTFRACANHIFDETRQAFDTLTMSLGDIVFVNGDYIDCFFKEMHPKIPLPYILITHNTLFAAPGDYKDYLNDDKIIAWFAKNSEIVGHPKLHGIPLGLSNRYWRHGNIDVVKNHMSKKYIKDKLLYLNFLVGTHDSRTEVVEMFKDQPYCYVAGRKPFAQYLDDIGRSKFVLSPRGAGMDCHRTWEALLIGSIPIIPSTAIDCLYEGLPVLIVKDWSIITEEYLNKKWEEMRKCSYDHKRMYADFWIDKIKMCQKMARINFGRTK